MISHARPRSDVSHSSCLTAVVFNPCRDRERRWNDQTDDEQWVHRTALPDPFLLLQKFWSKFSSPLLCDPFLTQDSEALVSFLLFLILQMARAAGACTAPRTIHSSTLAQKAKTRVHDLPLRQPFFSDAEYDAPYITGLKNLSCRV